MEFDLLKNGIDSLKQSQFSVDENYMNYEYESFQLKDGLFNFVHGFEILSKYIISKDNEENIIEKNFIEKYKIAKSKEETMNKSALELDSSIRTISVSKALDVLSDHYALDNNLYDNIKHLIKKRNILMHYTIEMDLGEKEDFAQILRDSIDMSIEYFNQHSWRFKHSYHEHDRLYPTTEFDEWEQKAIDADEARSEYSYIEHLIEEETKHLK